MGKYKVDVKKFNRIVAKIEKYKSDGYPSKTVRCVETVQSFENARQASRWVSEIRENFYNCCNPDLIKQCCRGKQKTSYGYHWEFVK